MLGIVLMSAYDADGFIGIQIDAYGEARSSMTPFQLRHPYGFAGIARDADADGTGCTLWYDYKGNVGVAWLLNDARVQDRLAELHPGETIHYGPTGQFTRMHDDGRITQFTTDDATLNGRSIYTELSPTDGWSLITPWGKVTFGPNGFHVKHSSGARFGLGAIGGLPAPLDALPSYISLSAAMIQIEASISAEGTVVGTPEPVAKATSTLAQLTAMQSAIAALQTAVTAVGASLSGIANGGVAAADVSATATGTSATAVSAAATALAAAALAIPSKSKQVT